MIKNIEYSVDYLSFASFSVFLFSSLLFLENVQVETITFWEGDD